MREIALKGLNGKKRYARLLIGMLALIYACSLMFIIFQESFLKTKEENRYQKYGAWTGAIIDSNKTIQNILESKENFKDITTVTIWNKFFIDNTECGTIGSVDNPEVTIKDLILLKGNLPTRSNEAAIQKHMLKYFPKDLQIGDKFSLSFPQDAGNSIQEFVLTGIIESWGKEWNMNGFTLPSVISTPEMMPENVLQTNLFFKQYHSEEITLQKPSFLTNSNVQGTYISNENAYPQNTSVADYFFEDGRYMMIIILISTILIGYALSISSKKRRYSLVMLRTMGASIDQIACLLLWESFIIWIIALFIGVLSGILGTFILLSIAKMVLHLPIYYGVNWGYILQSIIFTSVIYFIGNLSLVIQVTSIHVGSSLKDDSSALEKKKLPIINNVKNLTMLRIFKRNRSFHRSKTWLRMGLSFLVIIILVLCIQSFTKAVSAYQFWKEQDGYEYVFHSNNLQEGVSEAELKEITSIPGIVSFQAEKYLNTNDEEKKITISWAGWEKSDYVKNHRRYTQVYNSTQSYDKNADYFVMNEIRGVSPDNKEKLSYYSSVSAEGEFREDAFNLGNECILFLAPYQVRDQGYDIIDYEPVYIDTTIPKKGNNIFTYENDSTSIKPGDTVNVSTPWGTKEIKVGLIVRDTPPIDENVISVGNKFLDKLCGTENASLYNDITFYSSPDADFDETDRMMEDYFVALHSDAMLSNTRLAYADIASQNLREMFQSLTIVFLTFLLYFLIMYQGNTGHIEDERKRIGILRSMGMSSLSLKTMYLFEYVLEGLCILGASLTAICVWFIYQLRRDTSFYNLNSFIQGIKGSGETLELLFFSSLIAVLMFIGVYLITIYIPIRRTLKNNIIENIRGETKI